MSQETVEAADTGDIVVLGPFITKVVCGEAEKNSAFQSAIRVTLSPHEHSWTKREQQEMALYVLWASQRLAAIDHCVNSELKHSTNDNE